MFCVPINIDLLGVVNECGVVDVREEHGAGQPVNRSP